MWHLLWYLACSVKRDLLQCQKRPTTEWMWHLLWYLAWCWEIYCVKRDLLQCQKRPTTEWMWHLLWYLAWCWDSAAQTIDILCQKRPTTVSKETYDSVTVAWCWDSAAQTIELIGLIELIWYSISVESGVVQRQCRADNRIEFMWYLVWPLAWCRDSAPQTIESN
jgi:hypothetical protein